MKKVLLLIIFLSTATTLSAYVDDDMDGVDNAFDRCPNTSFTELVDINGCPIKNLDSPHHFDIIVGVSYSESDYQTLNKTDSVASSLQVDYYYKNFSLQASTSYYNTSSQGYSDNGLYDSYLGASYKFQPTNSLFLSVSAGALLPTYETTLNNNKTDYTSSFNVSYALERVNLFGSYAYTFINDDDIAGTVSYQNTNAFNVGVGYNINNNFYMSSSYYESDSIYKDVDTIQILSLYAYYSIDKHWFSTFTYEYGLSQSASKNYASIRLGYLF